MQTSHSLDAKNLSCMRGHVRVFDGVSLRLAEGGVLALTGANGSGKTSLLRVLAGLLPYDGALRVPPAHFIGTDDPFKPTLSVADNLDFWAAAQGVRFDRAALQPLAIERLADTPLRLLSRGQARRVSLSRLFLSPRPLWLLDEPESGLDDPTLALLQAALADHAASGGMAMIATHQPHLWQADCLRLAEAV